MPDQAKEALGLSGKLRAVPVEIRVAVGRAHPSIAELMNMRKEEVLPLDRRLDDPVELFIGDRLVALGELIETDDGGLGVRVTDLVDGANA